MKKLLLVFLLLISACTTHNYIVEQFVGKDVHEAYEWCAKLDDSHSCEVIYEDNDDYEEDIIFEQSVGAGKKLDFLMQEFNRETNTICSKSNDLAITGYGLSLKNEIEKVREQVQNLE